MRKGTLSGYKEYARAIALKFAIDFPMYIGRQHWY